MATQAKQPITENLYAKLIFLGGAGVGKSSILARESGEYCKTKTIPTIAPELAEVKLTFPQEYPGKCLILRCWDTAGQERFRSLAQNYYRNVDAAMVVYDMTDLASFSMVKTWANDLMKATADRLPLFCVMANKLDLANYRKIDQWIGKFYADSIHAPYFETSAYSYRGIHEAFQALGLELLKHDMVHYEDTNGTVPLHYPKEKKKCACQKD